MVLVAEKLPLKEYEINISLMNEQYKDSTIFTGDPYYVSISGEDLNLLKQGIDDCIYQLIEIYQLSGTLLLQVEVLEINNRDGGTYREEDMIENTYEVIKPNIVLSDKPSRYIKWKEHQIPFVFAIDKEKSNLGRRI